MRSRNDPGLRPARVSREILDAVRGYILPAAADPVFVSLEALDVRVAADLRNVTVVLGPLAGEDLDEGAVRAALERATPFFRRELGEIVSMKRMPIVRLEYRAPKS